ncbi:16S rRNA (cytidine(1402)-2'-O)-methyltransferase [Chondromyces apiculatus]|uniref:Ribosomal RNA small subunit methyltransferase I n=1 Tax=Chondromyces apiculatus DSM 436 TaxID=1192034 RepID=A0A017SYX5_9BACT|nr:16S rRNA (cytidine(1402)-2'-O)-methyltransferase [Chondromyces apiculatus]EYF02184.1 rRNA small subunit methyltransferase I [Chondromyces apiculatus DSM 436]
MPVGTLYVVATPIGHLGDITQRAVEVLRAADRILAEDTRRARALLSHLGIGGKPVDRLDEHASDADLARAAAHLAAGEQLAFMTDAGTPVVSDPGNALVRAAAAAGAPVVPIPGASAVMAALSVSGLVTGGFRFVGFLPRGGRERREALALVASTPEAVVLFESPHRTTDTLRDLAERIPRRQVLIARELTKVHEELLRGSLADLAARAQEREWRGEVTLVVGPAEPGEAGEAEGLSDAEIDARIDRDLALGRRPRDIADELSVELGVPRRTIYARVTARKG